jgi:glutamate formiminotransferase
MDLDPDRFVECVPNFSEGRRSEVIHEIVGAFTRAHPDVLELHRTADPDHNRSVLTLAGPGPALVEAAVAGAAACARLIDLTEQAGAHPRMGALDVLPFVPLGRVAMAECVALAEAAGRRIAAQVGFGSPTAFRERFKRVVGTSPHAYRTSFRPALAGT